MKTIDEIKTKIKSDIEDSIELVMIAMCDGIHPLWLFIPECYKEEFKEEVIPLTRENIINEMQDYIDFALMKAYDQRGLSAERSIWKFKQWLWALDDGNITNFNFDDYGIKLLKTIIHEYNLTIEEIK